MEPHGEAELRFVWLHVPRIILVPFRFDWSQPISNQELARLTPTPTSSPRRESPCDQKGSFL